MFGTIGSRSIAGRGGRRAEAAASAWAAYTGAVTITAEQNPSGTGVTLGGNAQFTVTFGAGATFGPGYALKLRNIDGYTGIGSGRAKLIHSSAGEFSDIFIYPGCEAFIAYSAASKQLVVLVTRFQPLTAPTVLIDPLNGSDTANDGLAGGSGGSFNGTVYSGTSGAYQTISGALANLSRYFDCAAVSGLIIQFADGTYSQSSQVTFARIGAQETLIFLQGNVSNPGNVVIKATTNNITIFLTTDDVQVSTNSAGGFTLQADTGVTGVTGIWAANNAVFDIDNIVFGEMPGGKHINLDTGGRSGINGNYEITGGAANHFMISGGASFHWVGSRTVTVSNTPNFTGAFAATGVGGIIESNGVPLAFSGSATGQEFSWNADSAVDVNTTTFPGSTAGVDYRPGNWPAVQAEPSNPNPVSSSGMAGLGVTFTPIQSGRIFIAGQAEGSNSTAGSGGQAHVRYGTGTPPVNGGALAGTQASASNGGTSATANAKFPLATIGTVVGLVPGTTYWFDLWLVPSSGGSFTIVNPGIVIIEL